MFQSFQSAKFIHIHAPVFRKGFSPFSRSVRSPFLHALWLIFSIKLGEHRRAKLSLIVTGTFCYHTSLPIWTLVYWKLTTVLLFLARYLRTQTLAVLYNLRWTLWAVCPLLILRRRRMIEIFIALAVHSLFFLSEVYFNDANFEGEVVPLGPGEIIIIVYGTYL